MPFSVALLLIIIAGGAATYYWFRYGQFEENFLIGRLKTTCVLFFYPISVPYLIYKHFNTKQTVRS
jgi:hypothetical protein